MNRHEEILSKYETPMLTRKGNLIKVITKENALKAMMELEESISPASPVRDEFIEKHLAKVWEKTKEAQIERFIKPMFGSLEAASIEHFLNTGTVSGSFYLNLMNMMEAVKNWKSSPLPSPPKTTYP
jgi:predicted transcriptional regulator